MSESLPAPNLPSGIVLSHPCCKSLCPAESSFLFPSIALSGIISLNILTFEQKCFFFTGQGRFGKVYTAVNNQTGEMLAMKEISLLPNDHKMIKRVAEEIKTFEGLTHENLVKYYGVEIHRVSNYPYPKNTILFTFTIFRRK